MQTLTKTDFTFNHQTKKSKGKVRDIYYIGNNFLVLVTTDRISAFDAIMPRGIPYKGAILNDIASQNLKQCSDIIENWIISCPHPMVMFGKRCQPIMLEFVIRGYLAGHAWREYSTGKRILCGKKLPDGLKQNDKLPQPILTPSTKSGNKDRDISREEAIKQGLCDEKTFDFIEEKSLQLFKRGSKLALEKELILVDTKYEFGMLNGKIILIDEIHTPDSSRYFIAKDYAKRQKNNEPQKQLSKEFLREWLIEKGFQGKMGQEIPPFSEKNIESISNRYQELFKKLMGKTISSFGNLDYDKKTITQAVNQAISHLSKIDF